MLPHQRRALPQHPAAGRAHAASRLASPESPCPARIHWQSAQSRTPLTRPLQDQSPPCFRSMRGSVFERAHAALRRRLQVPRRRQKPRTLLSILAQIMPEPCRRICDLPAIVCISQAVADTVSSCESTYRCQQWVAGHGTRRTMKALHHVQWMSCTAEQAPRVAIIALRQRGSLDAASTCGATHAKAKSEHRLSRL